MRTYEESEDLKHSDTEITLGTSSILGIFIGLTLICGIFFGFGYSLGRSHTPRASAAAQTAPPQTLNSTPSPIKTVVETADGNTAKPAAGAPVPAPALTASASTPAVTPATASTPGQVAPASYNAAAPPKPVSAALTTPAASIMVQIAAVSRPEDATVLVSALKGLGYNASVRSEPTDKLYHVQVGPFATRNEAMAMRAKLINDGYNAILK